jgi:hypothetical protein
LYNFSAVVQNLFWVISAFPHHPAKVIPEPDRSASFSFALQQKYTDKGVISKLLLGQKMCVRCVRNYTWEAPLAR